MTMHNRIPNRYVLALRDRATGQLTDPVLLDDWNEAMAWIATEAEHHGVEVEFVVDQHERKLIDGAELTGALLDWREDAAADRAHDRSLVWPAGER